MFYLWIIVGLAAAAFLTLGYEGILKADRAKQAEKARVAQVEAQRIADDANAKVSSVEAEKLVAYRQGVAAAGAMITKARMKGAADVANFAAFKELKCVWPQEVVDNLNAARLTITGQLYDGGDASPNVPTTTDPGRVSSAVPRPAASAGRPTGNAVPGATPGHRPLGALRPAAPKPN